jgi:SAF domain
MNEWIAPRRGRSGGSTVSDVHLPAVRAARLRTPSWRDARLLIGVLIVLLSVVAGARVVALADRTVPVYAAAVALPSGHVLTQGDLTAVRVLLGAGTAHYLTARASPPTGLVLARPVGAGELVPLAALGAASSITRRPVGIPLPEPRPVGLQPGTPVDVWSSAKETADGATGYRAPVRIAVGVEVYAVSRADPGQLAGTGESVQVLLEEGELRSVLDALANGAKLVVVPAPGGVPLPEGHA